MPTLLRNYKSSTKVFNTDDKGYWVKDDARSFVGGKYTTQPINPSSIQELLQLAKSHPYNSFSLWTVNREYHHGSAYKKGLKDSAGSWCSAATNPNTITDMLVFDIEELHEVPCFFTPEEFENTKILAKQEEYFETNALYLIENYFKCHKEFKNAEIWATPTGSTFNPVKMLKDTLDFRCRIFIQNKEAVSPLSIEKFADAKLPNIADLSVYHRAQHILVHPAIVDGKPMPEFTVKVAGGKAELSSKEYPVSEEELTSTTSRAHVLDYDVKAWLNNISFTNTEITDFQKKTILSIWKSYQDSSVKRDAQAICHFASFKICNYLFSQGIDPEKVLKELSSILVPEGYDDSKIYKFRTESRLDAIKYIISGSKRELTVGESLPVDLHARYLSDAVTFPDLMEKKTLLCLKADHGSGKTYFAQTKLLSRSPNLLMINPFISLTSANAERIDGTAVSSRHKSDYLDDAVSTTLFSLRKLMKKDPGIFDIVFIDEIDSCLNMLQSKTLLNDVQFMEMVTAFRKVISNARLVVLADAGLSNETVQSFCALVGIEEPSKAFENIYSVKMPQRDMVGRKVFVGGYEHFEEYCAEIGLDHERAITGYTGGPLSVGISEANIELPKRDTKWSFATPIEDSARALQLRAQIDKEYSTEGKAKKFFDTYSLKDGFIPWKKIEKHMKSIKPLSAAQANEFAKDIVAREGHVLKNKGFDVTLAVHGENSKHANLSTFLRNPSEYAKQLTHLRYNTAMSTGVSIEKAFAVAKLFCATSNTTPSDLMQSITRERYWGVAYVSIPRGAYMFADAKIGQTTQAIAALRKDIILPLYLRNTREKQFLALGMSWNLAVRGAKVMVSDFYTDIPSAGSSKVTALQNLVTHLKAQFKDSDVAVNDKLSIILAAQDSDVKEKFELLYENAEKDLQDSGQEITTYKVLKSINSVAFDKFEKYYSLLGTTLVDLVRHLTSFDLKEAAKILKEHQLSLGTLVPTRPQQFRTANLRNGISTVCGISYVLTKEAKENDITLADAFNITSWSPRTKKDKEDLAARIAFLQDSTNIRSTLNSSNLTAIEEYYKDKDAEKASVARKLATLLITA